MMQYRRCSVKTLNYEQGLLNNGTTNIITDLQGFTWVSTQTGVQRYNGYMLEKINPVINNKTISINSPVYFFAMQNGSIWISYKNGILEYDPHTNLFRQIISGKNTDNLNFFIVPLKETNEGIWCIEQNQGIIIYSKQGKVNSVIKTDNYFKNTIPEQELVLINTIFASNDTYIFLYAGRDKIAQLNLKTHLLNYINTVAVVSLACNQTDLFITSATGLLNINIANGRVVKNLLFKKIITENVTYSCLCLADNNELIIGLNNHLFELDTSFTNTKEITDLNRNPLLLQGFIRMIYTDKYKRIWLLTNNDIKRIQNADTPFEHFIYTGEKNNFVRSLYYDEKKNILLAGCYNGGLQLYDANGNALWPKALIKDTVKDISGIEKLTDNDYLVITIGRGWYILHLPLQQIRNFNLSDSFENILHTHLSTFSNNIQPINDSTIYIATAANVFRCIFYQTVLKSATPLLPFRSDRLNNITCFIHASNNTLWAGTFTGIIYRIDKNNTLQTIHIPDNYLIRSFATDASNNTWAGTDKGLYVYSSAGKLIKTITTESGLLNDCIYAMLPVDNAPEVFASSNLGLTDISITGKLINYTKESGLQENEFNTGSSVKTSGGKFYMGGVNGITSFYPAALSSIKDSPVINITKLIINDSAYNFISAIGKDDTISLEYYQNHIQLDIAALGLLNTIEYEYKYRLTKFEKQWQTTHLPTGIKYNLEPGKYVLDISCRPVLSSNSIFNKRIIIIVHSPWWQTWWFNTFLVASGIAIIAFFVLQYNRRKYLQRIRSLEIQHEVQHERERISRDLHDNLGAYAAAISANVAAIKDTENPGNNSVFNKLQINSQSIINQLNDTIWALHKEAISLTAISDRFKIFLQKIQPNYAHVTVIINENITIDQALSPANALHLFRIMQEAVNNALRHSKCSNIIISINSGHTWEIQISDDGKGIQNAENFSAGNGLKNIKLRCAEAGWQAVWQNAAPAGTQLVIHPALL